ncbi:3-oxoacyl-(acyl carrier protein) synthase I [Catenovulum agarivorans DS-2]|uniref:3-oxoacyl-(Acyl carrier protein) synthase I n=1 Tax=Catenovulum agarivorans DS-2 TaxID=1328313 RepID=W7QRZ0_9ALTE|nr:beta-ketoacyl-[acyl-carrier-protein] synthase family protein [Catenovulum agarivorans]EWH10608.1 3-oxoacyl-(acyl carrier protein) synthase I [Catenovulum agarivorans DS-2]
MNNTLYINEFGVVCPLGLGKEQVAESLFSGQRTGLVSRSDLLVDGDVYVGEVQADLPSVSGFAKHFQTRNNQLALAAFEQISAKLTTLRSHIPANRIGVIVGTSTSGIAEGENAMQYQKLHGQFPENYHYQQQEMSNLAEFIAQVADVSGPYLTISTACSSSAKSFVTASEWIAAGIVDAVIVGGVDSLCQMTINGFSALESTSAGVCQPFSASRDGINIGEAGALAIVSKQPDGFQVWGGESSDAHHMSAPDPTGLGAVTSIRNALAAANISSTQIDYVNLHGTATVKNDLMESGAVAEVFGTDMPASSTKSLTGHCLGAAGALEAIFCCIALSQQQLPIHVWDAKPDDNIAQLNWVDSTNYQQTVNYCLSNSFAFGGNNVSLIIGKHNG